MTNTLQNERKLNTQQLFTIELLYKFRFLTPQLLQKLKRLKSTESINIHLKTLTDSNYIGKHYDSSYRIQGRGAEYYLLKKAVALLKGRDDIPDKALNLMYHNGKIKPEGVQRYLDIAEIFLRLRDSYPEDFFIYTKHELAQFSYFPSILPDLYLNRDEHIENRNNEYMLNVFIDEPVYRIKQRLSAYVEHYEDGEWQKKAGAAYPAAILVCKDAKTERSIHRYVSLRLGFYADIYTTNIDALRSKETEIWRDCEEPDEAIKL